MRRVRHQIGLLAAAQHDNIHLAVGRFNQVSPFRVTFCWRPMHHQALTFNDEPFNAGLTATRSGFTTASAPLLVSRIFSGC